MEQTAIRQVEKWGKEVDGIFTIKDLEAIFSQKTKASFFRVLRNLIELNELVRVKNGLYALPSASLISISNRIDPKSYISTGTALARDKIIGSVPEKRVQAVKVGSPRRFTCPLGTIEFLSIAERLFFGFKKIAGINWAVPEKAFLDACYFQYKGKRYSFDLDTDVDSRAFKPTTLKAYLKKYDQKFLAYFRKLEIQ